MNIREANLSDSAAIADIYNYYVESTFISFEEEIVASSEMAKRVEQVVAAGYPWLVMEIDGEVVGYAYASTWKARSAYRFTVEPSVYVSHRHTGKGLGIALYTALFERLKQDNFTNVIGVIALPNPASIRLHERLGFKKVGEFANIGVKFGEKRSVGYWQLELAE
ncbi:GNAT family N-acetyltransferase [Vibrio sp. SCSIO 43136]|uniref:GNAT family N-acetyltransferase n=1 Tax=Vibrio sp. SCSIO 43136 TaxID=2819101 RepID=UPI0020751036|nr:GNAT family N-acetyltransferase [Vibrio sp. SCSIO 43136]USD67307.1 N-acetyltransferase [Vibrio sp. SCSIO 43136]